MNSSKKVVRKSFVLLLLAFIVLMIAIYITLNTVWFNRNVSVRDPNRDGIAKIDYVYPPDKRSFSLFYSLVKDDLSRNGSSSTKEDGVVEVLWYQNVIVIPLDIFAVGLVLAGLGLRARKADKHQTVSKVGGKS